MRMTPEEFQAWGQRLQFTSETEALIVAIRSSPPVRRVRGRAKNITGRYPSPKMQLGKMPGPPHNAQTGLAAAPVPTSKPLPLPQVAPKPTKARVGQRGLGRDPVGETSALPLRTATGCTFSGKIDLLPHQMEVAAVFHVECPECLAMREIHPKGDRVMFSWHVRRVTNTPNHGKRWVRRGSIWELAD
jgi:hypothetical protein